MSIRGSVTFECDQPRCHAEFVRQFVSDDEVNIDRYGLSVEASAEGWRMDDDGLLVCPQCADENPREKGDDDGVEYADPRDAREGRL